MSYHKTTGYFMGIQSVLVTGSVATGDEYEDLSHCCCHSLL
jgi:hypothetical protein